MGDSLALAHAIDGFELSLRARSLSPNTIKDYLCTLRKFREFVPGDPLISEIRKETIEAFLAHLSESMTNKSLLNRWIGLSAFWTWCVDEHLTRHHIVRKVKPPRPETKVIDPLTEMDVRALMTAAERSRSYRSNVFPGNVDNALPFAVRNKALILLLLDTGLRASELCSLSIHDVDIKSGHLTVMGKGSKERQIPFSHRTAQALWRYLGQRQAPGPDDPLFLSRGGYRLGREELAHTMKMIGQRANVQSHVHPHRFRHTFAINYLRNGGDVYTLQKILGHSTMEMCRRYLALAQVDLDTAHRRASPVDRWRL
jgi:integrase/recombinase XerD